MATKLKGNWVRPFAEAQAEYLRGGRAVPELITDMYTAEVLGVTLPELDAMRVIDVVDALGYHLGKRIAEHQHGRSQAQHNRRR